jgi:polyvinyl alcohol dehydrogenase (cytochrome)
MIYGFEMKALVISMLLAGGLSAASDSGEAVYGQRCARCHELNNPRIPTRATLKQMPATRILRALNYGAMISIAYTMTISQREAVANWLGTAGGESAPPPSAFCADRSVRVPEGNSAQWNGWSPSASNTRFQPAGAAGLTLDAVHNLKLKWAFAFDGDLTAFSQPTILGNNLFVGSAGGAIHNLDPQTGCIRWVWQGSGPVRSSLLLAHDSGRDVLLFGDQSGWFYALDAVTAQLIWKKKMDPHDATRITGSAVALQGVVYVPVSSWEENRASDPEYGCCNMRGSVVALRIRDGSQIWKSYMVDPPKQTGKNKFGPSGAPIWSAPTIDTKRGLLYVTTGDNYSEPDTKLSDALVAVELKSGKIAWSRQFTARDIFTGGCQAAGYCGPDYDFGSSAMLVNAGGRNLLVAGQKSGIVYALDPDRKGQIVWQLRVGEGGNNGGVLWGMAADDRYAYAAVSDISRTRRAAGDPSDLRPFDPNPGKGGGLTAIRLADGSSAWHVPGHPCDPPKPGCSPAQPAAVTGIPGVVFSGSVDGHLRAFGAEDGRVLWDFDTVRSYDAVNGIKGQGGSIDGPGAVVVNGMVYVNSGYARQGGMPGNVLLAFQSQ